MTGTLHIVVAMKPLAGNFVSNARKHGVAGLNIDGCRIAGPKGEGVWGTSNKTIRTDRKFNASPEMTDYRSEQHSGGRWPSNLVLVHLAGCRCVGVKKVKGNPHLGQKNPELVKQYGGGIFGGGQVTPGGGYAAEDGTEAVEHWECESGCPVGIMDGQSGIRKTTWVSSTHQNNRKGEFLGGVGHPGEQGYNDTGGASRYFKQVREE